MARKRISQQPPPNHSFGDGFGGGGPLFLPDAQGLPLLQYDGRLGAGVQGPLQSDYYRKQDAQQRQLQLCLGCLWFCRSRGQARAGLGIAGTCRAEESQACMEQSFLAAVVPVAPAGPQGFCAGSKDDRVCSCQAVSLVHQRCLISAGRGDEPSSAIVFSQVEGPVNASAYNSLVAGKQGLPPTNIVAMLNDITDICGLADLTHNQKQLGLNKKNG